MQDLGGLPRLLSLAYPTKNWDGAFFIRPTKKSAQRELKNTIQAIFPREELIEEHIIETTEGEGALLSAPRLIEIDLFLPDLQLGLEFQGRHHYQDVDRVGSLQPKERADAMKARVASQRGITLITVPFWWDFQKESLENTIHEVRPDLVPHRTGAGLCIPLKPPVGAAEAFSSRESSNGILSMTLKDRKLRRSRRPAELKAQADAEANG